MAKKTKTQTQTNTTDTSLAELEARRKLLKAQLRQQGEFDKKHAKLVAMRDGEINEHNPKGRHNPAILPETLRRAAEDETIDGKRCHGWVVEIACQECSTRRTINLQDAFQVQYCKEHVGEARKAAAKARRAEQRLTNADPEQLKADIAKLEAMLAAKTAAVA